MHIMHQTRIQLTIVVSGYTPLHEAARRGWLDTGRYIIDRVGDKNQLNNHNITPLHLAAGNGHVNFCRLIIDKVEDKNPGNRLGETPLHVAAIAGQKRSAGSSLTSWMTIGL